MNSFTEINQFPPVALARLFALDKKGPIFSETELTKIHALNAKEKEFITRKNEYSRMPARDRVRGEAAAYARGEGPAPTQDLDQASNTAELIRFKILDERRKWFTQEARPFFHALFLRLLERTLSALAEVEKVQDKQAETLGLAYLKPPLVRSIERTAQLLHFDAERFADPTFSAYEIQSLFIRKFGVEAPEPAAEPACV